MKKPNLQFKTHYSRLTTHNSQLTIRNSSQAGFTMIEMIFYMLFVVMILGGSIAITYQILSNSYELKEGMALEEEGNFILRKIGWVLNDITAINFPVTPNTSGDHLTVTKFGAGQVTIDSNSGVVRVNNGSGAASISSGRFNVSDLNFEFIREGTSPNETDVVKASFLIDGRPFKLSRHIR